MGRSKTVPGRFKSHFGLGQSDRGIKSDGGVDLEVSGYPGGAVEAVTGHRGIGIGYLHHTTRVINIGQFRPVLLVGRYFDSVVKRGRTSEGKLDQLS